MSKKDNEVKIEKSEKRIIHESYIPRPGVSKDRELNNEKPGLGTKPIEKGVGGSE